MIGKLPEASNMLKVMKVRLRIEPALTQIAAMRDLAAGAAGAAGMDDRESRDGALHRAIFAAAGNTLFLALLNLADRVPQDDAWRHVRDNIRASEPVAQYQSQHAQIIDAVELRNTVAAEKTMRQHLPAPRERLLFQTAGDGRSAPRLSTPRRDDCRHQLSNGMRRRVMIAMAPANDPALLIADEPTMALDVSVQVQVINLHEDLKAEFDLTLALIAHDLAVSRRMCDRVAVMYLGEVVELAGTGQSRAFVGRIVYALLCDKPEDITGA